VGDHTGKGDCNRSVAGKNKHGVAARLSPATGMIISSTITISRQRSLIGV